MNTFEYNDPSIWEDMRERLMRLTLKQLKKLAKDEHVTLGYGACRKDTCVGAIVSARRNRSLSQRKDPNTHPWRRWNSVNTMTIKYHTHA